MKLSDAEWTVMNEVWRQSPVKTRDVLEAVEGETGWAYTTVKTILTRLVDKGALHMRMRANTSLFEPRISREKARRSAVKSLLERAFDGTFGSLVQHMMTEERLSAGDRKKLSTMLAELKKRGDKHP